MYRQDEQDIELHQAIELWAKLTLVFISVHTWLVFPTRKNENDGVVRIILNNHPFLRDLTFSVNSWVNG